MKCAAIPWGRSPYRFVTVTFLIEFVTDGEVVEDRFWILRDAWDRCGRNSVDSTSSGDPSERLLQPTRRAVHLSSLLDDGEFGSEKARELCGAVPGHR